MCDAELARRFGLDRVLCAAQKNSFNSLSFVLFRRLQNRRRAVVRDQVCWAKFDKLTRDKTDKAVIRCILLRRRETELQSGVNNVR